MFKKEEFYKFVSEIKEYLEDNFAKYNRSVIHFDVWDENRKEYIPLYFKSIEPEDDIGNTIIHFTYQFPIGRTVLLK